MQAALKTAGGGRVAGGAWGGEDEDDDGAAVAGVGTVDAAGGAHRGLGFPGAGRRTWFGLAHLTSLLRPASTFTLAAFTLAVIFIVVATITLSGSRYAAFLISSAPPPPPPPASTASCAPFKKRLFEVREGTSGLANLTDNKKHDPGRWGQDGECPLAESEGRRREAYGLGVDRNRGDE